MNQNQPMSPEEKSQLFKILGEQSETLSELKRGMYGDDKNKQKGVIQDVAEIKAWIEKSKVKVTIISTVAATIGFFLNKGWEWAVHK